MSVEHTAGPVPTAQPERPWRLKLLLPCLLACLPLPALADGTPALRQALSAVCVQPSSNLTEMAARISGARGIAEDPLVMRGATIGWERRFALPDAAEIRIESVAPGGQLRRLLIEYHAPEPGGGTRPGMALTADGSCAVTSGRRLLYEPGSPHPVAIEHLDRALESTGDREPLNPPVPPGRDRGGVPVALVDSGVNYLLPDIKRALARDGDGRILGHDYWDRDDRPFDANPARSVFFPQRHGTRTASLLLREAPAARLVPYRYPRPDMDRMTALIDDAAAKGVVVMNISMGSNRREDWEAFAAAAENHPDMLFVLSAGNNGRDIDAQPVYPAALALDNTITVTSSEDSGELARGSNWGGRAVDLMVPAERLVVTAFDGGEIAVSGSSYAAVRISALAARLLARHPGWRAPELTTAIFARALLPPVTVAGRIAEGFMPRPDKAERLPPMQAGGEPRIVARHRIEPGELYPDRASLTTAAHAFEPTFAYFEDGARNLADLRRHAREAAAILAQCDVVLTAVDVPVLDGPEQYRYFHQLLGERLVGALALPTPVVYFVRDTLQVDAYDAEAIGRSNSATRPLLRDTIWITEDIRDPGIALAHELAHVLMDSGKHVDTAGNLMRAETAPSNTRLTRRQCDDMVAHGRKNGLLGDPPGSPGREPAH
jgi:hypothetical protein